MPGRNGTSEFGSAAISPSAELARIWPHPQTQVEGDRAGQRSPPRPLQRRPGGLAAALQSPPVRQARSSAAPRAAARRVLMCRCRLALRCRRQGRTAEIAENWRVAHIDIAEQTWFQGVRRGGHRPTHGPNTCDRQRHPAQNGMSKFAIGDAHAGNTVERQIVGETTLVTEGYHLGSFLVQRRICAVSWCASWSATQDHHPSYRCKQRQDHRALSTHRLRARSIKFEPDSPGFR